MPCTASFRISLSVMSVFHLRPSVLPSNRGIISITVMRLTRLLFRRNWLPRLQELKHGRAAMIAITGMYFQTMVQGKPILAQLGEAFTLPSEVAKAGYYFPEGE